MGKNIRVDGALVQVEIKGRRDGQAIENVIHWSALDSQPDGSPVTYDTDDIEQLLNTAWLTHVMPMMLTTYTLDEIIYRHVIDMTWGDDPRKLDLLSSRVSKYGIGQPGGKGFISDPLATFSSIGIRKVTDDASKFSRGSIRLDGLREEDVNVSLINQVTVAEYEAAIADYATQFNVPNSDANFDLWKCVVFSRTKGYTPGGSVSRPGKDQCEQIVAWEGNSFLTSQVSRKRTAGGA